MLLDHFKWSRMFTALVSTVATIGSLWKDVHTIIESLPPMKQPGTIAILDCFTARSSMRTPTGPPGSWFQSAHQRGSPSSPPRTKQSASSVPFSAPGRFERSNRRPPNRVNVTRNEPPQRWFELRLRELWAYRELLYFFVWSDVKIRYKQTAIGVLWVVLQPLLTMLVFTLFFGKLAKLPSQGLPYPVFYFAAVVPWMYFSTALVAVTNIIVENQRMIT